MSQTHQQVLPYPSSNLNMIRFPFDRDHLQFDLTVYNPIMTQSRLSLHDLSVFFSHLTQHVNQFTGLKWTFLAVFLYGLAFVMDALMMSLSVLITISRYTFDPTMETIIFLIGITSALLSFIIWVILVTLCAGRTGRKERKIRVKLNDFISQQNPFFATIGLRWRLPVENNFDWIELWFDYKYIDGVNSQIIHNTLSKNPCYQPPKLFEEVGNKSQTQNVNDYNANSIFS